jgi:hypothetical protein
MIYVLIRQLIIEHEKDKYPLQLASIFSEAFDKRLKFSLKMPNAEQKMKMKNKALSDAKKQWVIAKQRKTAGELKF